MTTNIAETTIWRFAKFKHLAKNLIWQSSLPINYFKEPLVHEAATPNQYQENMLNLTESSIYNLVQKCPPPTTS